MDALDEQILKLIADNARIPFLEVARVCHVSGAAIHQRIQKLTRMGVLKGSQFVLNPEKIGYELLYPSLGTIEHLQPTKSGGPNTLDNMALASKALNNERAHRTFERQLTLYPETYENCQKYADRLIQLYKSGVFRKVGLSKWYIINFARKMSKMSPKSKPLILDLKKLH